MPLRLLTSLLLTLCLPPIAHAAWLEQQTAIMGTNIHVKFWHEDKEKGEHLMQQSLERFHQVDEQMSPYKADSELSRINTEAYRHPVTVSANLFALLQKSLQLSYLSHGAFDMTYASVGYLYDYRAGKMPDDKTIGENLSGINYRAVKLDAQTSSIRFLQEKTRIDLGGIAKGYAVDEVIKLLQQGGVTAAMVTAGGDSRIIGSKGDKPWIVGIKDPRQTDKPALLMPLEETAISTSGDYERFFIDEHQQRHHHILNPRTGKSPENGIQSVTILGPDATTTDGLSTTVFVLGLEQGLALVNRLPGIDAIIISQGGEIHYSEELERLK